MIKPFERRQSMAKPYQRMTKTELIAELLRLQREPGLPLAPSPDASAPAPSLALRGADPTLVAPAAELSRDRYAELYEYAPTTDLTLDHNGMIQSINLTGAAVLGADRERILGYPLLSFIAPGFKRTFLDFLLRSKREEKEVSLETTLRNRKGVELPVQISVRRTENPALRLPTFRAVIIGLSTRKAAEEYRTRLAHLLMGVQEDERKRLSRELHDHLGQLLAAFTVKLKLLSDLELDSGAAGLVEQLQEIAAALGREAHRLAIALRPTALDDVGLHAAVTNLVENFASAHEIQIDLHSRGLEGVRLPPLTETTVYRVVQESLTNVIKHSQACQVSLILDRRDREMNVIVEDDGCGFWPEAPRSEGRTTLGILGMRERVNLLGGELVIESSPGSGCTIFAKIPLPPP